MVKNAITLWCTSTHTQLAFIQHTQDIRSIAFSPDDRFLAIGGKDGTIRIQSIIESIESHRIGRIWMAFIEPDIQSNDAALLSWKNNQLENTDALLTTMISQVHSPSHYALASRAVIRARLQSGMQPSKTPKWYLLLCCPNTPALTSIHVKAIDIQPSIIAFMAKSVAHVGNGDKDKGYRTCDIAFAHFHSSHGTFLLLIKAIIVFMAGEHIDAISRLDDLIATVRFNSVCYTTGNSATI
ncbi:hypothetical protein L210DRAFT_3638521 [Boletus edulis BED1]|uniref:Uncharacterized protein n=1 Tax=Boletus edulis BED1 TaxID=1328754 RepID=A0AAD4GLK3_BOLED|nr:hypothetical protein L210DRAFT_3638521 [Boletus edulis BED1]